MRNLAVAVTAFYLACCVTAQQPTTNNPEPIYKVPPLYPPIARAANITGTVTVDLTIDVTGHVKQASPVNGPPMLVGSALDAVRQWLYKPFLVNGNAVEKTVRVYVVVGMPTRANPDDQKIAKRFFAADDACRNALRSPDTKSAATACSASAEIASTFSDQERFIERRSAYVYAASANLRDKQFDHALFYAEKAVTVVLQGHDDGSGSDAAYTVRAQAEAVVGNLTGADADLTTAEDFERKAIQDLAKSAPQLVAHEYTPNLKSQLLLHARVLDALKKPAEADAKRQEAAKL